MGISPGDWLQAGATIVGVGLAVWFAAAADRIGARRFELEQATMKLSAAASHFLVALRPGSGIPTTYGSEWSRRQEEMLDLVQRVRVHARWPISNAKEIRRRADIFAGRTTALVFAHWEGQTITTQEMMELMPDLTDVVFAVSDHAKLLSDWFIEHGPTADPPSTRQLRNLRKQKGKDN